VRALVTDCSRCPTHITQQHLSVLNTLDLYFSLFAGLQIEAGKALEFVFLSHLSKSRTKRLFLCELQIAGGLTSKVLKEQSWGEHKIYRFIVQGRDTATGCRCGRSNKLRCYAGYVSCTCEVMRSMMIRGEESVCSGVLPGRLQCLSADLPTGI
jgi:hypothetical protein